MKLSDISRKQAIWIIASAIFLIAGIFIVKKFRKKPISEKNTEVSESQGIIRIAPGALEKMGIASEPALKTEFRETAELVGEVLPNPDRIARISARIPGRVSAVHFTEGSKVKKGQILAEIESPEASRLRSKFLSSYSKYLAAEKNVQRIRELAKLRLAGDQELVNAESEFKVQEAEWKGDRANLSVQGIPVPDFSRSGDAAVGRIYITSPLSGIALSRDAVPGAQVDASAVLGTVGDISEVWFMIKIFEKDLSKIREGTGARIILNAYPGETFEGRVDFIGNQIDPGSRTVNGRIVLKNRESRAKIGLFGKALIDIQDDSVLQIRSSALFESDRKKFVFVERSKGEYEAREVKTGRVSEDSLEILSGVIEGEKIIIKGVFSLKSVHLKSTFGEE